MDHRHLCPVPLIDPTSAAASSGIGCDFHMTLNPGKHEIDSPVYADGKAGYEIDSALNPVRLGNPNCWDS